MGAACCCADPGHPTMTDWNSRLYRPVEFQQRLEEILDFWFRDESADGGINLNLYDRET